MPTPRAFPLADVLTVTTGRLLSHRHVAGLYEILNFLTGDDLMTHQLGRATEACRPSIVAQHSWLADDIDTADLFSWLAAVENAHGDVDLLPIGGWVHRDPIEEACDLVGADKVIVVHVD